jgi:hypothetical protein
MLYYDLELNGPRHKRIINKTLSKPGILHAEIFDGSNPNILFGHMVYNSLYLNVNDTPNSNSNNIEFNIDYEFNDQSDSNNPHLINARLFSYRNPQLNYYNKTLEFNLENPFVVNNPNEVYNHFTNNINNLIYYKYNFINNWNPTNIKVKIYFSDYGAKKIEKLIMYSSDN